jgi:hypothetical protein
MNISIAPSTPVPSFAERRAMITSTDELEKQITLSREYVKRCRRHAKQSGLTLEQKLAWDQRQKEAEKVVRELRRKAFDIEDELASQR